MEANFEHALSSQAALGASDSFLFAAAAGGALQTSAGTPKSAKIQLSGAFQAPPPPPPQQQQSKDKAMEEMVSALPDSPRGTVRGKFLDSQLFCFATLGSLVFQSSVIFQLALFVLITIMLMCLP